MARLKQLRTRRQYNTQKSRLASHLRFLFLEFHPRTRHLFSLFSTCPFLPSSADAHPISASPVPSVLLRHAVSVTHPGKVLGASCPWWKSLGFFPQKAVAARLFTGDRDFVAINDRSSSPCARSGFCYLSDDSFSQCRVTASNTGRCGFSGDEWLGTVHWRWETIVLIVESNNVENLKCENWRS